MAPSMNFVSRWRDKRVVIETKIRSYRAIKIFKNQGLYFYDNYRQLQYQLLSIQGLFLLLL